MDNTTRNATNAASSAASSVSSSLSDAQTDVKTLVKDAQSLLTAAAALTGEKADDLRKRGMELLDVAMKKAGEVQGQALVKGKELAKTADTYVQDNPWRTVAAAAGVGLLVGVILGRK
ncbi:YqjD family protein [Massilia sp. R2A-15]|uniref:DUF883 family protein n=1 Tax=Massilia sp. R2A-15 TaxID=3064278 RepID=UPI0035A6A48B